MARTQRGPWSTQSTNLEIYWFRETESTNVDLLWIRAWSSAYALWLCSAVFLWDSQKCELSLSLTLLPMLDTIGTLFLILDCLVGS